MRVTGQHDSDRIPDDGRRTREQGIWERISL
jgi:hypothetical protein